MNVTTVKMHELRMKIHIIELPTIRPVSVSRSKKFIPKNVCSPHVNEIHGVLGLSSVFFTYGDERRRQV